MAGIARIKSKMAALAVDCSSLRGPMIRQQAPPQRCEDIGTTNEFDAASESEVDPYEMEQEIRLEQEGIPDDM